MMYHLKWIAKHDGIYSAVLELSRMLWYSKQFRTAGRQKNKVYRLKSARGDYRISKTSSKLWELKRRFTTIGRLTLNPLRVYAALYQINRNGGATYETA
jgi:hypothetical protein